MGYKAKRDGLRKETSDGDTLTTALGKPRIWHRDVLRGHGGWEMERGDNPPPAAGFGESLTPHTPCGRLAVGYAEAPLSATDSETGGERGRVFLH
jgi:hypothetical protein